MNTLQKKTHTSQLRNISFIIISLLISGLLVSSPLVGAISGVQSTAPSTSVSSDVIARAYAQWKQSYLTSSGADGNLRVQRSSNDNYDTVSEGIGYGLLFSVYNNDKTTFDKLFAYEQAHLNDNSLMNWRISAGGNATGYNGATDADEDIAIALVAADKTWGGYEQAAKKQIILILNHEVEAGSNILKPGDKWGGSSVLNPSYISPSYYTVFASYTDNAQWNQIKQANYQVIKNIDASTPTKKTGLFPDWSMASGSKAGDQSFSYGYDAARAPIRLALASLWDGDATATDRLETFNGFFASKNIASVVDGYALDGQATDSKHNGAALGPIASAAVVSSSSVYRSSTWNELVSATGGGYYPESLRLLALLTASNTFVSPLALIRQPAVIPPKPTQPPAPDPSPAPTPVANGSLSIWWPVDDATVTGVTPFKAMLTNNDVSNYQMYWQVDGGKLNLMSNNSEDYPHKQADVDVSGWKWHGEGPYTITFVAKDLNGNILKTRSSTITINH